MSGRRALVLSLVLVALFALAVASCGEKAPAVQQPDGAPAESTGSPTQLTMLSISEGEVLVKKAGSGDWVSGQAGTTLESGDSIKAGSGSRAVITFFEGSTIELEADTAVEIGELDLASSGTTTISIKQSMGKTVSRVKKLADSASRYEVETPAAVALARGTIMVVLVDDDTGETWVSNEGGEVWVSAAGSTVQVPVGLQSTVLPGQPPSPPAPPVSPVPPQEGGDGGGGGGDDPPRILAIVTAKVPDRTQAHEGDVITYTYTVANTGNTALPNVSVSDDKAGEATYQSGDTNGNRRLDVRETWRFTATYNVTAGDPNPLVNTATTTIRTISGVVLTAVDTASVAILRPAIAVNKTAEPTEAYDGDVITYTYEVRNTGNTALIDVSVDDDIAGQAVYQGGDTNGDGQLDTDEIWVFTTSYAIPDGAESPVVNTATATGTDALGLTVSGQDSASVTILRPAIALIKTADRGQAHVGDVVGYTYQVSNPGNISLSDVAVDDDIAGQAVYQSGDSNGDGKLNPGETWTFTASHTVTGQDPSPLVNTGTASGADVLSRVVTAEDSASVAVLRPAIALAKSADVWAAHEGDTITYTYQVTNPGNTALTDVSVDDDIAGQAVYQGGDSNGDGRLDPGETWTFAASHTATGQDPSPLVNTAIASGRDALSQAVNAQDSASVTVLRPAIAVDKQADVSEAYEGDVVTYTYDVTNSGNTALSNVSVADDVAGQAAYQTGDTNGNNQLDDGETWTFLKTYTVGIGDPNPLVNIATASGTDALSHVVTANESASVTVQRLVVNIADPEDGADVTSRTITVAGTVSDPSVTQASISINGESHAIAVVNGEFGTSENVGNGEHTITVTVVKSDGVSASDTVVIDVQIPVYAIRVELTWDSNETDVDLHLIRPGGETWSIPDDCFWQNPNPNWGIAGDTEDNPSLDQDDRDGYGPENITLEDPSEVGTYLCKIEYFDDFGHGDTLAIVRIWINDEKVAEYSKVLSTGELWDCAAIEWPSGTVLP